MSLRKGRGVRGGRRKQTVSHDRGLECIGEVLRGLEGQEVLIGISIGRWGETVLAVEEHVLLGVASGEAAGLGSEVKEDGI